MEGQAAAEALRGLLPYARGRSPLTERLLAGLAGAAERGFDGGVVARLLSGRANVAEARLLLLAALHHAALEDPTLPHAAWYATAAGGRVRSSDDGAPAALALAYLVEHEDIAAGFIGRHRVQANDVGMGAALLPGVLQAAGYGQPLRLLDLGASAGLQLRLDRYRIRYVGGPDWGPRAGPVLDSRAEGRVPRTLAPPTVEVAERRGVDLHPLDLDDPAHRRLLTSFLLPDDPASHRRLEAAIEVARASPAVIDEGDLVPWAEAQVRPVEGLTTVVLASAVRGGLEPQAASRLDAALERGLRAATATAAVVVLTLEPPPGVPDDGSNWPELTVATGDGSGPPTRRILLSADWHGRWVRFF